MEGVSSSAGVFQIVLPTKLPLRGQLDTTVIQQSVWFDLAVILQGGGGSYGVCSVEDGAYHESREVCSMDVLRSKHVIPEVVGA